jgi:hypothetical protein
VYLFGGARTGANARHRRMPERKLQGGRRQRHTVGLAHFGDRSDPTE